MHWRTRYSIVVITLAVCALAESAAAYYGPRQGRFISRDPIGEQGGLNLYCYTRNSPPARYDPLGQVDQPNPGPPGGGWSRKLEWGPRLLDGRQISYDVAIKHVWPKPPNGATQIWQVVACARFYLVNATREEFIPEPMFIYRVDIFSIGDHEDQLAWIINVDACIGLEYCVHTVGFDDGQGRYAPQANVNVSVADATTVLTQMRGPKAAFTTKYRFLKKANCCSAVRKLSEWAGMRDGEELTIEGLGTWHSK